MFVKTLIAPQSLLFIYFKTQGFGNVFETHLFLFWLLKNIDMWLEAD